MGRRTPVGRGRGPVPLRCGSDPAVELDRVAAATLRDEPNELRRMVHGRQVRAGADHERLLVQCELPDPEAPPLAAACRARTAPEDMAYTTRPQLIVGNRRAVARTDVSHPTSILRKRSTASLGPKSSSSNSWRISISPSLSSRAGLGKRRAHSIASSFDFTWIMV